MIGKSSSPGTANDEVEVPVLRGQSRGDDVGTGSVHPRGDVETLDVELDPLVTGLESVQSLHIARIELGNCAPHD